MPDDRAEKDLLVRNKMGLHARPAALIVQTANKYPCDVALVKDGQEVNGKSIMGVLMLIAAKGSLITIRGRGADAQGCVDALGELVKSRFGEER